MIGRVAFCGLLSVGLVHCASADGSDPSATSSAAVTSNTRTFLVPVDARARLACRDEVNAYYCDAAAAESAITSCLAKIATTGARDVCSANDPRCVRTETYAEPCTGRANPVYPTEATCASPRPQNCSFYSACVERATSCGEDGYALGYGEKYCTAFKNISGLSAKGIAWRDSVMHCLHEELVPYARAANRASCDTIVDVAFDSHPRCYTKPDNSICFLSPSDTFKVIGTIGGKSLLEARSIKQIQTTVGLCLGQIGRWLFPFGQVRTQAIAGADTDGAVDPEMTQDELRAQYAMWQQIERDLAATPDR
jgi:hypothetical protein